MITCPSCGTETTGRFCPNCGHGASAASCPGCSLPSELGSKFCRHCGLPMSGAAATGERPDLIRRYAPWTLGGVFAVALTLLFLKQPGPGGATPSPNDQQPSRPAAGTPPDLSTMTPRERFNRLYTRIITAAQTGDQATVEQFTPMAIAAYGMLDKVDPDAHYHLAMIQLHIGDLAGAQAQADSLIKTDPNHLFGYVIDAAVARWNKDDAKRKAAYQGFLRRYDLEIKSTKPEYAEHSSMLAEVKKAADGK